MRIEFLDPAQKELTDAIAWYNQESEGLGYRFAAEVRKTLARILQSPLHGRSFQRVHAAAERAGFPTASSIRSAMMRY